MRALLCNLAHANARRPSKNVELIFSITATSAIQRPGKLFVTTCSFYAFLCVYFMYSVDLYVLIAIAIAI